MANRAKDGAGSPASDLSTRLASAAMQAIRKSHHQTGSIPERTRTTRFAVRFDDGRRAEYRLTLEYVREMSA